MADTIQKYRDYVMTGFLKSVVPIVVEKARGAVITDTGGREYLDCFACRDCRRQCRPLQPSRNRRGRQKAQE